MSAIENVSAAQANILAATQRQDVAQQFGLRPGETSSGDEAVQQTGAVQTQTRDALQATDEAETSQEAANENEQDEGDQFLSDQQLQQAQVLAQNGASGRGVFLNIQL